MKKRRTQTDKLTNKKMSPEVYRLRREVIALIHEAKKLADLPRITVRVADNHRKILGVAAMNQNIIWITEESVASRAVVFHEILHAVYGQQHVEGCPLMAPAISKDLDQKTCNRLFVKYAKRSGQQKSLAV